jgi:hypothetical protein
LSINSKIVNPITIEIKKIKPLSLPAPTRTSAGPGQIPAIPQPTPKMMLPITILLSIKLVVGKSMGVFKKVSCLFFAR